MMAELQAFQAITGSLKSAGEIAKALVSLKVTSDIQTKIIELNGSILAAQSSALSAQASQMELLERVRELESDSVKLKDWETEKQRYDPKRFDPGVVVPALKEEFVRSGELDHLLCPACYQKSEKSILQPTPELVRRYRVHRCPACQTELAFSYVPPNNPPNVQGGGGGSWMGT